MYSPPTSFSGNPLAVVLNAEGPVDAADAEHCRGIQSGGKLTFVLPPTDSAHNRPSADFYAARGDAVCGPSQTSAPAFVLARAGTSYGRAIPQDRVIFEEKAGLVPISLLKDGNVDRRRAAGIAAAIDGRRSGSGRGGSNRLVELLPMDIEIKNHAPCIASCGVGFILAEVRSRTALASAMPHIDVFRRDIVNRGTTGILIYTEVNDPDINIRARMFAPLKGIPEDSRYRKRECRADRIAGEA